MKTERTDDGRSRHWPDVATAACGRWIEGRWIRRLVKSLFILNRQRRTAAERVKMMSGCSRRTKDELTSAVDWKTVERMNFHAGCAQVEKK